MRILYRRIRSAFFGGTRRWCIRHAGLRGFGRVAAWIACRRTLPYHYRAYFADLYPSGFVAPSVVLAHDGLRLGDYVYLGDRTLVFKDINGGAVDLHEKVQVYGETLLRTGYGGSIEIGKRTHVQLGCFFVAGLAPIVLGEKVEIASACAFYSFSHGLDHGTPIMEQPLRSKGGVFVGDGAWLGHGVTVLDGVRIGEGAVVGAGAVVTHDVPDGAIAAGVPARIVGHRDATAGVGAGYYGSDDAGFP